MWTFLGGHIHFVGQLGWRLAPRAGRGSGQGVQGCRGSAPSLSCGLLAVPWCRSLGLLACLCPLSANCPSCALVPASSVLQRLLKTARVF